MKNFNQEYEFKRFLLISLILFLLKGTGTAQILFPGYHMTDYYDVLKMKNEQLKDPITFHPAIIYDYATDSALNWDLWDGKFNISKTPQNFIELINPYANVSYSNSFPDSYNDGPVWQGVGLNTSLNFGFTGRKGILSFTFAPVIYYAQNKKFYIAPSPFSKNEFSYPFEQKIDWVLRYGHQSITQFHLGQSEIRLIYKKATIGISTKSMIWGSAQVAPILMSNNAAGIPHIDIGTAIPIHTKIGAIEFRTFWGIINESDYFDIDQKNDQRYLTGAIFGYAPNFIPGLTLGINRVLYRNMFDGNFKVIDLFAALWKSIDDPDLPNDNYDQMISLIVQWKFKEYGFNTYIEFAKNDFPGDITDLLESPERTRAVTMGVVKTFDLKNGNLLRIVYEHTKLNHTRLTGILPGGQPTYYVHSVIENGYANNGQLIGAYVGPGSNANHIKLQYYSPGGRIGINIDRVRFNDDYFIDNFNTLTTQDDVPNDTRYRIGVDFLRFIGDFSLDANATFGYRRNWYYQKTRDVKNLSLSLKVGYLINNKQN